MTPSCWRERPIPPLDLASNALDVGVQALSIMLFPVLWEEYSVFDFYIAHKFMHIQKRMQFLGSSPVLRKTCGMLQGYISVRGKWLQTVSFMVDLLSIPFFTLPKNDVQKYFARERFERFYC